MAVHHHSKKGTVVGLAVLGALALALMYKQHLAATQATDENGNPIPNDGFSAPYYQSTPGIFDTPEILNGGSPFYSTINVGVDAGFGSSLATAYIPLFGFVGVVAQGGGVPANSVAPQAAAAASKVSATPAQWAFFEALNAPGVSLANRQSGAMMLAAQGFNPWGL